MTNILKKLIIPAAAFFFAAFNASAQKYCFVNSEYILEQIPAYKDAQAQLDQLSVKWQKEIEEKYANIDKLYKAYQAEQILLTEEMKKRSKDEILNREKNQMKSHFGRKLLVICYLLYVIRKSVNFVTISYNI